MPDAELVYEARAWFAVALLGLLVFAAVTVVRGYSDLTVEIHTGPASCPADGWCRPEFYVVRSDPAQPGSVKVDYVPSTDAMRWTITIRNIKNITVDALVNYNTQGCATFFADCPSTLHDAWLRNQDTLTVVIDTDVYVDSLTVLNVPAPYGVLLDGVGAYWDLAVDTGGRVYDIPVGVHILTLFMQPSPGTYGTDPGLQVSCDYNALTLVLTCADAFAWPPGANGTVCMALDGGPERCGPPGASSSWPVDGWFNFGEGVHVLHLSGGGQAKDVLVHTSGLPRLLLLAAVTVLVLLLIDSRRRARRKRK